MIARERLDDLAAFEAYAAAFARRLEAGDVVLLRGELGAGKTAFVRAATLALGSADPVSSPTFMFRHRYGGPVPVEHFDLYRIRNARDLLDTGLAEALGDGGAVVFVEWPERADPRTFGPRAIAVSIAGSGQGPRDVEIIQP